MLRKMLSLQPQKGPLVDVIVNRLLADLRPELQPQPIDLSDNSGGRIPVIDDFPLYEVRQLPIVPDLQPRTLRPKIVLIPLLCDLRRIPLLGCEIGMQVRIPPALELVVDC